LKLLNEYIFEELKLLNEYIFEELKIKIENWN
jgi:hypothetical protein